MVAASVIGIFLIPAIFYVVEKVSGATASRSDPFRPPEPSPASGD
jgi:hypothetical protein